MHKKSTSLFICLLPLFGMAQTAGRIEFANAKFRTGDNSNWASPFVEDTGWVSIRTDRNWEPQGFENYNGYAWYRLRFNLPSSLRKDAFWKDSLKLFLARIDDADEVFLNGSIIAKHGSFPDDNAGYITAWNIPREIHLAANNPFLFWDKENLLCIRVYDGGGPGGIFSAIPSLQMMDLADGLFISMDSNTVQLTNNLPFKVSGSFTVKQAASSIPLGSSELNTGDILSVPITRDWGTRTEITAVFIEKTTGKKISFSTVLPYILTPKAPPTPRINNTTVFGVRPGSPFLFKIAGTGQAPLQYAVENIPAGLKVDASTGIISGKLEKEGVYKMVLVIKNKLGVAKKPFTIKCGSLLALTPPMGWNSWNCWGLSVSDEKLRSSAQALIDKGLVDYGWTYMNIDDGWEAGERNKDILLSNEKFPDMPALGEWLHSKGLKFGIYSSPGPTTCGGYLGSYEHEWQDAQTFNNWGIDYLKYDWCSYGRIHGGKDSSLASYIKPYAVMQQALRQQPRDMIYSLCQYGMKDVWTWGQQVDGNCWRTTGDIEDSWESLKSIGFSQNKMSPYAKPGRWNDPDMLIVGQVGWGEHLHPTRLTPDEQYTHISLWCLLSAPLLIGCDISRMDAFTVSLLTNNEVLAIDQDPLGKQARQVVVTGDYQVWVKELSDGNNAIGVFNLSETTQQINVPLTAYLPGANLKVRDLWRQKDLGRFTNFSTSVPPHGVMLIKLSR